MKFAEICLSVQDVNISKCTSCLVIAEAFLSKTSLQNSIEKVILNGKTLSLKNERLEGETWTQLLIWNRNTNNYVLQFSVHTWCYVMIHWFYGNVYRFYRSVHPSVRSSSAPCLWSGHGGSKLKRCTQTSLSSVTCLSSFWGTLSHSQRRYINLYSTEFWAHPGPPPWVHQMLKPPHLMPFDV